MVEAYTLSMKYRSYDIIRILIERIMREKAIHSAVVLDLTYGRGRFYRKIDRGRVHLFV